MFQCRVRIHGFQSRKRVVFLQVSSHPSDTCLINPYTNPYVITYITYVETISALGIVSMDLEGDNKSSRDKCTFSVVTRVPYIPI